MSGGHRGVAWCGAVRRGVRGHRGRGAVRCGGPVGLVARDGGCQGVASQRRHSCTRVVGRRPPASPPPSTIRRRLIPPPLQPNPRARRSQGAHLQQRLPARLDPVNVPGDQRQGGVREGAVRPRRGAHRLRQRRAGEAGGAQHGHAGGARREEQGDAWCGWHAATHNRACVRTRTRAAAGDARARPPGTSLQQPEPDTGWGEAPRCSTRQHALDTPQATRRARRRARVARLQPLTALSLPTTRTNVRTTGRTDERTNERTNEPTNERTPGEKDRIHEPQRRLGTRR